jgi:hypothetical protein
VGLQAVFSRNFIAASLDHANGWRGESPGSFLLDLLARYNQMIADEPDDRLQVEIPRSSDYRTMQVRVPTFDPDGLVEYDYNRSELVTVEEVGGLRVVMGETNDRNSPDVFIERSVGLWRVAVHPNNGDPLCIIEIGSGHATIETDEGTLLLEQHLE